MTRCEDCGRPATHKRRSSDGEETFLYCCECNYQHSYGGTRCTEDDDCWTVDESNEWRRKNHPDLYCVDCGTSKEHSEGRCPNGIGGFHSFAERVA